MLSGDHCKVLKKPVFELLLFEVSITVACFEAISTFINDKFPEVMVPVPKYVVSKAIDLLSGDYIIPLIALWFSDS